MSSPIVIAALYRFVRLDNYQSLRQPLLDFMLDKQLRGTVLLAAEGINGTIAGNAEAIESILDYLCQDDRLRELDYKLSFDDEMPFYRSRVKLKREIVTMGVEDLEPAQGGTYVDARDWNALIDDPDVTLIDTRNAYESAIGTFTGAIQPQTDSFREFPEYAKQNLDPGKHRKVAMFCTGGIRCEKSTAYLRQQGFDEVYHLRGGILKYLEEVPQQESRWHGECFVFDNRVSVNHALEKGSYDQCHACRLPITEEDKRNALYQPGVSCPACHGSHSEEEKNRFREREKQVRLARERGERHLGTDAVVQAGKRKALKLANKLNQRERAS
jgi:UPF0176 protein